MTDAAPVSDHGGSGGRGVRLADLGPAIIVASVVLGPGTILGASRVGAEYGADMLWVLALSAAAMAGTASVAARAGAALPGSPGDALAASLGRPFAVVVGGTLFLVVAGFQASNNLAVIAAAEPLLGGVWGGAFPPAVTAGVLLVVNAAVAAAAYRLRGLYRKLEGLMKVLVGLMAAAFAVNLFAARPSVVDALRGLVPELPPGGVAGFLPRRAGGAVVVPHLALLGLIATTFSIAGAFYQAYLVREKGWRAADGRKAAGEAVVGAAVLGLLSAMVLLTAAATLHGRGGPLGSTADLAAQLRPLFGPWAVGLFSAGIFAGAFGSFLGNALIGGTLLADGLGKGGTLDSPWVRGLTVAALAVGLLVALAILSGGADRVTSILIAQALTVLGGPLLAGTILYLAIRIAPRPPAWALMLAGGGAVLVALLAGLTAWRLVLTALPA